MRTALSLFVGLLVSYAARADEPSAADFDTQIAKLTPTATKDERLAAAKWVRANFASKHAPRAIPALEELVRKDPEAAVRRVAVESLVHIVNRHDVPCPLGLVVALRDPVDEVRWSASVLPGPYKRRLAPGAFDALLAAAADDRPGVRVNALIHLSHAAGKDPKARAVIEKAKGDKSFEVRCTAHSAWFTATHDLPAYLAFMVRVREEPKTVLDPLPEDSEEAKDQRKRRNLVILGHSILIADWAESRPDDLAIALLGLLNDKSAAMRRGAAELLGVVARKAEIPHAEPLGFDWNKSPLSLLPYPELKEKEEKIPPKPRPSEAYARLLARNADAKLRDLAAKDPDETVRAAARRSLDRWKEAPVPLDIPPRELKR
jgi:hypothetical protein